MNDCPQPDNRSALFTNEVMLCRALAAEIRHDATRATPLLEQHLQITPGTLGRVEEVTCEANARIDIKITYSSKATLGIEAKIDHEITSTQIDKQRPEVDHLVLLVPTIEDAGTHAEEVDAVLTWKELLATFPDSRVTMADVESIPLSKVRVERLLRGLKLKEQLSTVRHDDWHIDYQRNDSGLPAITIISPPLPDGLQLRSQLQVTGRRMPDTLDAVELEFHAGIEVSLTDTCFPDPTNTKDAPDWARHLKCLRDDVLPGKVDEYDIRTNPARNGKGPIGSRKVPLAKRFLGENDLWLAVGYCTWALGPRTKAVNISELGDLADRGVRLMQAWYEAETSQTKSQGAYR